MKRKLYYILNVDGSVSDCSPTPFGDALRLEECPDISLYKYVNGEWAVDAALALKEVQDTRAKLYDIGRQVGALVNQANKDRMEGKALIQELDDAIGEVLAIKKANPKPEVEEEVTNDTI